MPYVKVNCPSCGGDIQLDDERESGVCLYCGSKVIFKDAIQRNDLSVSHKHENFMKIATNAYKVKNYPEAEEYFRKVLELDADNWEAMLYKEFSRCWTEPVSKHPLLKAMENSKIVLSIAINKQNNNDEINTIKGKIYFELCYLVAGTIKADDLSKISYFNDMETYVIALNNFLNCSAVYEYCVSLIIDNPKFEFDLIRLYGWIIWLNTEAAEFKKLSNSQNVGADRQSRRIIVERFDAYVFKLKALVPDTNIKKYKIEKKYVENY